MKTQKQVTGQWGEDEASQFLQDQGYDIVERNFRTRMGELDIIAWHTKPHFGKTLCFVEVKTRASGEGSAERATGASKLSNLFAAARAYCLKNTINTETTPIQFEQVSIYGSNDHIEQILHHIIPIE